MVNNFNLSNNPNFISGCVFESAAGVVPGKTYAQTPGSKTLRAPRTGEIGEIGIVSNTVLNLVVGFGLSTGNMFDGLIIGIHSLNSNIESYGNTFKNLSTNLANANQAGISSYGIYAAGAFQNYRAIIGATNNTKNKFYNCRNGIHLASRVNGRIHHNIFDSIYEKAIYIGGSRSTTTNVINKNKIDHALVGVHCYFNSFPSDSVRTYITQNTINASWPFSTKGIWLQEFSYNSIGRYYVQLNALSNISFGVQAENLYKPLIEQNNINIAPVVNNPTAKGISIYGCYGARIYNNNLKGIPATASVTVGGIYASLSFISTIQCNDTRDLGYGIRCAGLMPSSVYNNVMRNEFYGFWLSNNGFIGRQDNLPVGPPQTNDPSYNQFFGTFSSGFRSYTSDSTDGTSSYFVYRGSPAKYNPNPADFNIQSSLFQHILSGPSNAQAPLCQGIAVPAGLAAKHAKKIAQDSIPFTGNIANAKWLNKQGLFTNLLLDTVNLQNDTILQNFVTTTNSSNAGVIYNAYKELSNNHIVQAQNYLNQLSPNNTIESNHQYILSTVLINLQNGNGLTQTQITNVRILAHKCPFTDGIGVYQARAMLALIDSVGTIYQDACEEGNLGEPSPAEGGNGRKAKPNNNQLTQNAIEETAAEILVYPNPANETLFIELDNNEFTNANFELYTMLGEKVMAYALNTNEQISSISLQQLAAGVYYYIIKDNNQVIKKDKVIIIK